MALGSGRRIVVEFIGDASSLRRGIKDGEAALQGFSGKAQAAGRIAGRVLAGGLLLAGAAAISATKAAAEDEAAQSQLAQQLKQAAGATDEQIASTEDWITKQGLATGITDDELRPALARLATATGSVTEAQRLAALAMDTAAGSQKSYQQVTEAFSKAANGNVGALGRLGIATKNADGSAKSFAEIQQDLATKYMGAAAKAADTSAGKQKILTTQFGELQEQIGAKLLPVMVKLAEVGLKVVGWISENTKVVGILVASFGGLLAITTAVGAATKVAGAIQTVYAAITKTVAAGQWLLNAALTANPIGLVVVAIAALVAGLIIAYKNSETFRNIVDAAFGAIKDTIVAVVSFVVDFVKNHWKLLVGIIFGPLGVIVALVITHWDKIKAVIGAGMAAIKDVLSSAWDAIVGTVRAVLGVYKSVITAAFNAVRDFFQNAVAGWKTIFNNAWDAIKSGFQNAKDTLSDIAGRMRDAVSGAFGAIRDSIQPVIDKVQWLIDKIQALIDKVKSLPSIDIPGLRMGGGGGGGGGNNASALGSSPFVHPALVESAGTSARASAGGGSGSPVYLTVNMGLVTDPVAAAREVVKAVRKLERADGRRLLVSPN